MKNIADPEVVIDLAARLERLSSTQPRVWGRMTPHQMVVHLAEACEALLAGGPMPKARLPFSRLIKWVALYFPMRWPRGVQAGVDPAAKVLDPEAFERDRDRAIAALRALASHERALGSQHPIFGAMSRREWERWAFLHTDHHLRQFGL